MDLPDPHPPELAKAINQLRRIYALARANGEHGWAWWNRCARLLEIHLGAQHRWAQRRHARDMRANVWLRRQLDRLGDSDT